MNVIEDGLRIHRDFCWIACSTDGYDAKNNSIIEIKCPETTNQYSNIEQWFDNNKCKFLNREEIYVR